MKGTCMIYEKNSFERYREGEALSKKYTPRTAYWMIAVAIGGLGGMLLLAFIGENILWSIALVVGFGYFGTKDSLKATHGDMMMKSAEVTFGSDEEEY